MPSSSSSTAVHQRTRARIPPSAASIPPPETTPPPPHASLSSSPSPRAPTRFPYAHHRSPDVAAVSAPALSTSTLDREHRSRSALPTIDKVDSRPKTIAATVKSRAHSRLASFGRIRSRGALQPAEQNTPATETHPPAETFAPRSRPSISSSHKRSEPSTASYHSSETTLSDEKEKYYDTKSFDEPRQQSVARGAQRNASAERRAKIEDSTCDPTEQYRRLVESRPRMMHQTSSRLLRMTEDDRPFTRVSNTHFCACAPINSGDAVPRRRT